jgi:UDP:flavonoid glycosyltransferase YjiC (YdhE family)
MHCTILAVGSRGDVQPLIALGKGLKAAGHEVRFATHADFEPAVREHDLEFRAIEGNSGNFYSGRASAALAEKLHDEREFLRFFDQYLAMFLARLLDSCWEASRGTDLVICWPWTRFGPSLAERLGIPVIIVGVSPFLHLPTCTFPNPYQNAKHGRGPLYNYRSWRSALPFTKVAQKQIDHWRVEKLGLSPRPWIEDLRHLRSLPHLLGFSPSVLPRPFDWRRSIHISGYWFLDSAPRWQPPPELEAFLAAGPPPVAVGFSSSVGKDVNRITSLTTDALTRAGARAIFISGFGGLKGVDLPEHIFSVRTVPYDWLLPRVAAMVHHGGAGSTASVLRAGVPSFAVPFAYEQQLWGRRIAAIGAGLPPIPANGLTAENLAASITTLLRRDDLRAGARRISEKVRREDGIGDAVRYITRVADRHRGRRSVTRDEATASVR